MDFIILFGGLALILWLNIIVIIGSYIEHKRKKKMIVDEFKSWDGTKKPIIWSIIWSILLSFNLLIYCVLNFILQLDREDFVGVFVLAYIPWMIIIALFYTIAKMMLKGNNKDKD